MSEHQYQLKIEWTGNTGSGTKDYRSYERAHTINHPGKHEILGSSDPSFKGDDKRWNPEEMLLGSLASCHMLWYLHLLSVNKIVATSYVDEPTATLEVDTKGEGKIVKATLNPVIAITDPSRIEEAKKLHDDAHKKCFIVRSINFPVEINPTIH